MANLIIPQRNAFYRLPVLGRFFTISRRYPFVAFFILFCQLIISSLLDCLCLKDRDGQVP